jgi:pyridoxamine 5'-phosphate oxidase
MTARLDSLHEIESACWAQMEQACRERDHAWRTMALATRDGDRADARTVVLREASRSAGTLLFYADDRSPKLDQLRRHPKGTLLLWSPALGWQLRLRVHLKPVPDGLDVTSRWARLQLTPAAQDYLSPLAPGQALQADVPSTTGRAARDYFAVVSAQLEALDWLELHAEGHRRAVFDARGARWVQP